MSGLLTLVSWSVCTGVLCKVYGHITHLFCLYSYSVFGSLWYPAEVNGFLEFISVILQTGSVPSSGICVYITVVSLDGLILSSIDKPFVSDFSPAVFSHLLVSIFLNYSFGVYCLCFCFPPHFASFFLGRDALLFPLIVCFQVMVFRGSWVLFWTVLSAWPRSTFYLFLNGNWRLTGHFFGIPSKCLW